MGALATDARWQGFACGFAGACCGEIATAPLDLVKTRLQVATELGRAPARAGYGRGFVAALRAIARDEGAAELYRGLRPALLRQASYGTLRVGAYEPVKAALEAAGVAPGLPLKLLAGMLCGGAASGLCCPTDVAKVRMQADGLAGRRRYSGALHALRSIHAAEGLRGLWSGVVPTMQRAAVVAAVELASYDELKEQLARRLALDAAAASTHLLASVSAGFLSALAASPMDVLRSRLMLQPRDAATGRGLRYASTLDCLRQSVRAEGVRALWKGLGPAFARQGPHCVVNFLVIEQLRNRFFNIGVR
jgi:hypothetical protein